MMAILFKMKSLQRDAYIFHWNNSKTANGLNEIMVLWCNRVVF